MKNGSVYPGLLETLLKMNVWGDVNLILSIIIKGTKQGSAEIALSGNRLLAKQ